MAEPTGVIFQLIGTSETNFNSSTSTDFYLGASGVTHGSLGLLNNTTTLTKIGVLDATLAHFGMLWGVDTIGTIQNTLLTKSIYVVQGDTSFEIVNSATQWWNRPSRFWWLSTPLTATTKTAMLSLTNSTEFGVVIADAGQLTLVKTYIDDDLVATDETDPVLDSVNSDGSVIILTYNEALDTAHIPDLTDYNVQRSSTRINVSSISIDGATVNLKLAKPIHHMQTVTLSYTQNATESKRIQDAAGNFADAFSNSAVTDILKPVYVLIKA